jgi:hypothetical protein
MSLKDKIKEANKSGNVYIITDPTENVMTLPDGEMCWKSSSLARTKTLT